MIYLQSIQYKLKRKRINKYIKYKEVKYKYNLNKISITDKNNMLTNPP